MLISSHISDYHKINCCLLVYDRLSSIWHIVVWSCLANWSSKLYLVISVLLSSR